MNSVIGIDFDNTIADYDLAFAQVANELGYLNEDGILSKSDVKKYLLSQTNGDEKWQRLQGQIYGKYMRIAEVFPGFMEFIILAKIKKIQVYIVSHKSEFGHFDENKVSLRDEAMKWILSKKIVDPEKGKLNKENVFFETTREDKIHRIATLGCSCFIDDLPEVFNESIFPEAIKKYLFDPFQKAGKSTVFSNVHSWRKLAIEVLGDWDNINIAEATGLIFPGFNITDVELRKGRGNSRIYRLTLNNEQKVALKIYPDRQADKRPRLETEFSALNILGEKAFSVPGALRKDPDMNWAIYSWIDGDMPNADEPFIHEAIRFIEDLKELSQSSVKFQHFGQASEACLDGREIETQINKRLSVLKSVSSAVLQEFLETEFLPTFHSCVKFAKRLVGDQFGVSLDPSLQIPSPSDFGSHNAIKDHSGKTVFIDFEYFGWDDPVKLVSDFYWHPAMDLQDPLKELWITRSKDIFLDDELFHKRLMAYLPLYGLRWCLILLNEFLPHRMQHRIHADKSKTDDILKIQMEQLSKAKKLLIQINKININHGSTFQTS